MEKRKIKIAIVDDHQIVIDGLLSLLQGHPNFEIVSTTTDPHQAIKLLDQHEVDILLTDVMMPGLNGHELAKQVRQKFPSIKIMALSMSGEGDVVNKMIEDADISGYVLKNIGKQELILALEKISNGGIYFSEEVLNELIKVSERKKESQEAHLTEREIEIIKLIEKEYSNKQIAETLFISERTVETHRKKYLPKNQNIRRYRIDKICVRIQIDLRTQVCPRFNRLS